ncbi:MAG: hypothetical protein M1334_04335, partial [Patescibacteria group bacterium]|nr:hypothetical protein [Patescibacteria group bacterium]
MKFERLTENLNKPEQKTPEERPAKETLAGSKERKLNPEAQERQSENYSEKSKEEFKQIKEKIEEDKKSQRAPFGNIEPYLVSHDRIEFPVKKQEELEYNVSYLQKKDRYKGPRLFTGNKTATEYDSRAENFSTQTAIQTLSTGEKIFIVDSYPLSFIHRFTDGVAKYLTGVKSYKVPNRIWKETFEDRSNIPTIRIGNKNSVAMPYIENVNLRDLMGFNKEIKNWGAVKWCKDINLDQKKEIIKNVARETEKVHQMGKTWGESILANMIIDNDKKVWICDP